MLLSLFMSMLMVQSPGAPATLSPVPSPDAGGTASVTLNPSATPVLSTSKLYFPPHQPLTVKVNSAGPVDILVVDFIGRSRSLRASNVGPGDVDLQKYFSDSLNDAGVYLVLAVAPGGLAADFVGTPMVLTVRTDSRRGAPSGPLVLHMVPLQYAKFETTAGDLRVCFYYDSAPITVNTVQRLIKDGFYDGLDFFRVEPNFVVQTGDPRGDGTGGPGFSIDAEFSDRFHYRGVLSMARLSDPNDAPLLVPRPEFANTAGSQFFICLSYEATKQLDRRYTAFARVVDGDATLTAISSAPLVENTSRPKAPVKIIKASLVPVTPGDNPYARLRVVETATTQPATQTPAFAPVPEAAPAPVPNAPKP